MTETHRPDPAETPTVVVAPCWVGGIIARLVAEGDMCYVEEWDGSGWTRETSVDWGEVMKAPPVNPECPCPGCAPSRTTLAVLFD